MMSRPPRKVLVAYSMYSTFTATTLEYMTALQRYTDFDVSYVHATHDAEMDFDINDFDVVVQNYCVRLCFEGYVSPSYKTALRRFQGLKVLAVQDDYDRTATLHRGIRDLGFHVLVTCIQSEFWPKVYPESALPGLHKVQGLTGYMPESMVAKGLQSRPLRERPILVGYRGRDIGARYGRLGFDKYEIGRRMIEICSARGLTYDIAMDEASRIYGDRWYDFLANCRVVLGSESGSNVFDFNGEVERKHEEMRAELGRPPTYPEFRPYVDHIESQFDVGQISPRVFECAVMRTPMVLFRGRYSDVIEPDVHYIPLEKDFSNVDDVLRRIEDIPALEVMAERAYERLVSSGVYGYEAFAVQLKAQIDSQYELLVARKATDTTSHDAVVASTAPGHPSNAELAERPTSRPQSEADIKRREVRRELAYYAAKFPELHSYYPGAVAGCMSEVARLAEQAKPSGSTDELIARSEQLMHLQKEIEQELQAVASRVELLRREREAARATGDSETEDALLADELAVLKKYFERGPELYQRFEARYQRQRARLELSYYAQKFPDLRTSYLGAVAACMAHVAQLAARGDADHTTDKFRADSEQLRVLRVEIERELQLVASRVELLRRRRDEERTRADSAAEEASIDEELTTLRQYFERGQQLYQEFDATYQGIRGRKYAAVRRMPGFELLLRLRRYLRGRAS